MHHAGDPCVYPAYKQDRFDNVAFGYDAIDFDDEDFTVKRLWMDGMKAYAFGGQLLFPTNGMFRHKGDYDSLIPPYLWDMAVSCYLGPNGTTPCGKCPKCIP